MSPACTVAFTSAAGWLDRPRRSGCQKALRYSEFMFDVLVYLYENYWRPDSCPEPKQLERKLVAVGFENEEIQDALRWLDGLASNAEGVAGGPTTDSIRIYTDGEREVLGDESIGFITFLESAGVLPPPMREMVIDRATAIGGGPIDLEDLKIIVLMVFWSLGEEPDALILDELFVAPEERVVH
jgi:Smg protein